MCFLAIYLCSCWVCCPRKIPDGESQIVIKNDWQEQNKTKHTNRQTKIKGRKREREGEERERGRERERGIELAGTQLFLQPEVYLAEWSKQHYLHCKRVGCWFSASPLVTLYANTSLLALLFSVHSTETGYSNMNTQPPVNQELWLLVVH